MRNHIMLSVLIIDHRGRHGEDRVPLKLITQAAVMVLSGLMEANKLLLLGQQYPIPNCQVGNVSCLCYIVVTYTDMSNPR